MSHFVLSTSAAGVRRFAQRRYCLKNLERGASLLEAVAYLGIAAVVVLGAVSLLNGAFGSAKSNQATEEVLALRTAVRKLYIGQTYPTGDLVGSMVASNGIPGTVARVGAAASTGGGAATGSSTLQNSWGGAITIVGAGTVFTISYAAVPRDVCVNMISGASGWTAITQGSGTTATTATATGALPTFTAQQATTLCPADNNTVNFTAS